MGMGVLTKYVQEEGGAGRENHLNINLVIILNLTHFTCFLLWCLLLSFHLCDLVCLNLLVTACQGHIKEVLVLPQLLERRAELVLKVIPPKTEFFCW